MGKEIYQLDRKSSRMIADCLGITIPARKLQNIARISKPLSFYATGQQVSVFCSLYSF
jgi:hypothetical protein